MLPRGTGRTLATIVFLFMVTDSRAQDRTLTVLRAQPAHEQRIALVIGNSNYSDAPLRNPGNDARAFSDQLRQIGFQVMLLENADLEQMFGAIRTFGDRLRGGGVGVFYFAGHGVQVRGRNYLIPVAAQIQREDEVLYRSIDAGQVLNKMETAGNRLNIVILDACRNNPFRSFRSLSNGLAVMEAPVNTLIAFATAPGAVANDGAGSHGLYTEHLLKNIPVEGLRLEDMFKRVRASVRQDSAGRQVPWENTSLEVEFYFRPLASQVVPDQPGGTTHPLAIELAFWETIKSSGERADFDAYLRKYPSGQFAELARNRLAVMRPVAPTPTSAPNVSASSPSPGAVVPVSALPSTQAAPVVPPPRPPSAPTPASLPQVSDQNSPFKILAGSEVVDTAVAFSPNRGFAVTGSRDGVLSIWDVTTSKELRRLLGHSGAIRSVTLSPDSRLMASGGEDAILRLWSVSGARELRRFSAGDVITAIAFSPDGRYLISGARGGILKLWNTSDGSSIMSFAGHPFSVRTVAFSMEGRYVLSGSADGYVGVWDVSSGAPKARLGPHSSEVIAVRMSRDGSTLFSASADGIVWSWDINSGKGNSRMPSNGSAAAMVALSDDGRHALIARNDGRTILWDTGEAREIRHFSSPARAVTAVALSPESKLALVAADGQRIRLWALND